MHSHSFFTEGRSLMGGALFGLLMTFAAPTAFSQAAAEEEDAPDPIAERILDLRKLYHSGAYVECVEEIAKVELALDDDRRLTSLKAKALSAQGKHEEAKDAIVSDWSFEDTQEALMMLHDLERAQGHFVQAEGYIDDLMRSTRFRGFQTPRDLLAIGRALLSRGGEPKDILDRFYKRALAMEPTLSEAHGHIGRLALEKYDSELAAEHFQSGLDIEPENADLRFGLARAFFDSERKTAVEILEANLEKNPHHVDSLLLMAEHHLLAEVEDNSEAEAFLRRAEAINATDPRIEAMRAALALLRADEATAAAHRDKARRERMSDPAIDYWIGEWLAGRMRFAEAVPYFRQALEVDEEYLPARIALGQNLLRVGAEDEAWLVLEGVHDRDQYNVAVYNLLSLHDSIEDYQIINRPNFIVRMEPKEAALFGDRVLDLLEQAERELHPKYGFKPENPILVEFYPEQEDFAVRTLGFVGGDGLLGACFGLVVTMNSPNNPGAGKSNWESTLWHEYCHAVTLGVTKNRMPRWLTEGISVYEERRRDPACGENMKLAYRSMILEGDELIPLSQLNYGFLRPKTPQHMLFAYYEASLFIEYFIENFGEEALRAILMDLREGLRFSEACERHAEDLPSMEKAFFAYAKQTAEAFGDGLDFSTPEQPLSEFPLEELALWVEKNPTNYHGLQTLAGALMSAQRWEDAQKPIEVILKHFPEHVEGGSPYVRLAEVSRQLGDSERERALLWELVSRSTDWLDEMLLLLRRETDAENWERVDVLARQIMAVNPYITRAQKALAEVYEATDRAEEAIGTYRKLLTLRPENPAQVHFRLAQLLHKSEPVLAKRHTLDALAEAPRYREAMQMLLAFPEPAAEDEEAVEDEAAAEGDETLPPTAPQSPQ